MCLLYAVKDITDYLEREQVDQVLDAARACSQRDYLMLRVLWRTGCRVSELLTITPSDVEFRNRVINITKGKGGEAATGVTRRGDRAVARRLRFQSTHPGESADLWHQTLPGPHAC